MTGFGFARRVARALLATTVASVTLAACSGGAPGTPGATPNNAPTATPTLSPSTPQAKVTLSFSVAGRTVGQGGKPDYISPNSTQVEVDVKLVNNQAPPPWVTPINIYNLIFSGTGQNCGVSNGMATCSISIPAPPGSVFYKFIVSGDTKQGQLLPVAAGTQTFQIVQGQPNSLAVTLGGVVAVVAVKNFPTLTAGTPIRAPGATLTVTAYDATGAAITGTNRYANGFTLTDGDVRGQSGLGTRLTVNGGAPAQEIAVIAPTDVVTMVYGGIGENPFAISARSDGLAGPVTSSSFIQQSSIVLQPITFTGTRIGTISKQMNQTILDVPFANPPVATQTTASEIGWSNPPYNFNFDIILNPGCAGLFTVAPAPGNPSVTFAFTPEQQNKFCQTQVLDGLTGHILPNGNPDPQTNGTLWVNVL